MSPCLGTPENVGVTEHFHPLLGPREGRGREPLLILSPFVWGSRENRGYIALPPSFGPPRRQGWGSQFWFCPPLFDSRTKDAVALAAPQPCHASFPTIPKPHFSRNSIWEPLLVTPTHTHTLWEKATNAHTHTHTHAVRCVEGLRCVGHYAQLSGTLQPVTDSPCAPVNTPCPHGSGFRMWLNCTSWRWSEGLQGNTIAGALLDRAGQRHHCPMAVIFPEYTRFADSLHCKYGSLCPPSADQQTAWPNQKCLGAWLLHRPTGRKVGGGGGGFHQGWVSMLVELQGVRSYSPFEEGILYSWISVFRVKRAGSEKSQRWGGGGGGSWCHRDNVPILELLTHRHHDFGGWCRAFGLPAGGCLQSLTLPILSHPHSWLRLCVCPMAPDRWPPLVCHTQRRHTTLTQWPQHTPRPTPGPRPQACAALPCDGAMGRQQLDKQTSTGTKQQMARRPNTRESGTWNQKCMQCTTTPNHKKGQ